MNKKVNAPAQCPSCGNQLNPTRYICSECNTEVSGNFSACPFCSLDKDNRNLLELFLITRGNLKAVQRMLNVSYPTARLRIEEMFNVLEKQMSNSRSALNVLEQLHKGELSIDDAIDLL